MPLLRSLLFIPGNRESMLRKALQVQADAVIPDLEDSVSAEEKPAARKLVSSILPWLRSQIPKKMRLIPRVNSIDTEWFEEDIKAVLQPGISAITIGKISSVEGLKAVAAKVADEEINTGLPLGSIKIIPWLETAEGVIRAREICGCESRVSAVAFGAEDFTADMQIERTTGGQEVLFARNLVAIAARAARILALDSPWTHFRDLSGLAEDCRLAKSLGYKGKFSIHPGNIEVINREFLPSSKELEHAKRIVEAFEAAKSTGRGSTSVDGAMVDEPVYKRAKTVVEMYNIAQS
eukprot:jgi/Galph1/4963/GphlegSOOS_G3607.1